MRHATTIKDIARSIGISSTTVSRALRDDPRIAVATKSKIQHAATAMGYVPNALARSLAERNTRTIGLVLPDIRHSEHFTSLVSGIQQSLFEHGFATYVCFSMNDNALEVRCLDMLRKRRVDGVVIVPVEQPAAENVKVIKSIAQTTPVVFLDRYLPGLGLPCITTDNRDGAYMAVTHLLEHGHRRIATLRLQVNASSVHERFAGYEQALRAYGIQPDPELSPICSLTPADVQTKVQDLLRLANPPSAFFAPNEGVLRDTMHLLQQCGLQVPEHLSVVTFDAPSADMDLVLPITYVEQPIAALASTCADILINSTVDWQLDAVNSTTHVTLLQPRLVPRSSVRKVLI